MANNIDDKIQDDELKTFHFEAYRQMLTSLFSATLTVVLVMTVIAFIIHLTLKVDPPILLGVAMFGALGALFSALMRLYTLRDLPKALFHPDLEHLRNKYLLMYSFTPIIIGFIAAVIVYLAVLSGVLGGEVFPTIHCPAEKEPCDSFDGLFNYGPVEAKDYAKALVIGFFSGFSERLIRDVLHSVESAGSR